MLEDVHVSLWDEISRGAPAFWRQDGNAPGWFEMGKRICEAVERLATQFRQELRFALDRRDAKIAELTEQLDEAETRILKLGGRTPDELAAKWAQAIDVARDHEERLDKLEAAQAKFEAADVGAVSRQTLERLVTRMDDRVAKLEAAAQVRPAQGPLPGCGCEPCEEKRADIVQRDIKPQEWNPFTCEPVKGDYNGPHGPVPMASAVQPEPLATPPLRWTKNPPSEPGWYWYRGSMGDVDIVRLAPGSARIDRLVAWWPEGHEAYADLFVSAEWAGPIPMPEEG